MSSYFYVFSDLFIVLGAGSVIRIWRAVERLVIWEYERGYKIFDYKSNDRFKYFS